MGAPPTLPADFFERQGKAPDTLPADFFDTGIDPYAGLSKAERLTAPEEPWYQRVPGAFLRGAGLPETFGDVPAWGQRLIGQEPGQPWKLGDPRDLFKPVTEPIKAASRNPSSETIAGAVPFIGPSFVEASKLAKGGRFGEAGATIAGAISPFVFGAPRVRAGLAKAAAEVEMPHPIRAIQEIGRNPKVVQSVVKEAMNLPPQAVNGVEDIVRAAAPTGGKPSFRGNVYAATGDLAEIGQKLDLKSAKGGFRNPDMRPRATVNALSEHLKGMYQQERLPQIQRHAENPVALKLSADAQDGLRYLSKTAGSAESRALAANTLGAETIPLVRADQLAKLVNQELVPFESLTPAKRMQAGMTNRRLGGLKQLDQSLKAKINEELGNRGEVGISAYERRFAAIAQIRDQLQARMNAAELERTSKLMRMARSALQGRAGIASASQAAVADVRMGDLLESGFRRLRQSGLKANRGTPGTAPRIAGLLPSTTAKGRTGGGYAWQEPPVDVPYEDVGVPFTAPKELPSGIWGPDYRTADMKRAARERTFNEILQRAKERKRGFNIIDRRKAD